jgi:hypothetical protein
MIALVMQAASISETLVNTHQTTRRYNAEGRQLHTGRLKSCLHLGLFYAGKLSEPEEAYERFGLRS